MSGRSPRQARVLGLWTACWLFVLLLAGVLRLGDLSVEWPVLLIPVLWALVALRPRRRSAAAPEVDDEEELRWYRGATSEHDEPYTRPEREPCTWPERAPGVRPEREPGAWPVRDPGTREQHQLPRVPPPRPRRED